MPKLNDLLKEKQEEMTDDQMYAKVKALNAVLGGVVRNGTKK
jgi:hypothetical protein